MGNDGDHDSPERIFARRQRHERERRGWRYQDLADAVAKQGIRLNYSAFAKTETAGRAVRLDEAVAVARAFGLLLSQMTTEAGSTQIEAELAAAQKEMAAAIDESEDAVRRAAIAWNRARELTFALGRTSEVPQ